MLCAGAVAGFAGDAGIRGAGIEVVFGGGGGGVTAEAEARFIRRDGTAGGIRESRGDGAWLPGGDVESLRSVVKADVAFKKSGVLLVEKSLAHVAGTEGPEKVDGKRRGCVADGESAFFFGGEELIGVGAGLKRQVVVFAKVLGL